MNRKLAKQTVAVWGQWHPDFKVGDDALAAHDASVQALPEAAQAVATQRDAVDDARAIRDGRIALIRELGVSLPRKLDGDLAASDPYHKDLADIRGIEMTGMSTTEKRGQMVYSLWLKLDARRAALVPPKPAMTVGGRTAAQLKTALTDLPAKKQDVEKAVSVLNDARGDLRALMLRVDALNKRWYAAWQGEYLEGTPERAALAQVDTGSPGSGDDGDAGGNGGDGPPPPTVPAKAQITNLTGSGTTTVDFDMTAVGATLFDLSAKLPGSNDFVLITADLTDPHYTWLNVAGAPYFVKVIGKNAQGSGPESDEVNFTGPA